MKTEVTICVEAIFLFFILATTASAATLNGSSLSSSPLDSSCQQVSIGELSASVTVWDKEERISLTLQGAEILVEEVINNANDC